LVGRLSLDEVDPLDDGRWLLAVLELRVDREAGRFSRRLEERPPAAGFEADADLVDAWRADRRFTGAEARGILAKQGSVGPSSVRFNSVGSILLGYFGHEANPNCFRLVLIFQTDEPKTQNDLDRASVSWQRIADYIQLQLKDQWLLSASNQRTRRGRQEEWDNAKKRLGQGKKMCGSIFFEDVWGKAGPARKFDSID